MKQKIKNMIGDFLGYARCDYSRMTFWKEEIISVMYLPSTGRMFVKKGVKELTDEQLIHFAKQLITFTMYDMQELTKYPKFKMYIRGR